MYKSEDLHYNECENHCATIPHQNISKILWINVEEISGEVLIHESPTRAANDEHHNADIIHVQVDIGPSHAIGERHRYEQTHEAGRYPQGYAVPVGVYTEHNGDNSCPDDVTHYKRPDWHKSGYGDAKETPSGEATPESRLKRRGVTLTELNLRINSIAKQELGYGPFASYRVDEIDSQN